LFNIFIEQLVLNFVVTQNLFCDVQVTSEKVSALMEVAQLRQDCHRFEEREKYAETPLLFIDNITDDC
jgi:MOSC domain-containing protein YiiM